MGGWLGRTVRTTPKTPTTPMPPTPPTPPCRPRQALFGVDMSPAASGRRAPPLPVETRTVIQHPGGGSPAPGLVFQTRARFFRTSGGGLYCRLARSSDAQRAGLGSYEELKRAVLGRVRVGARRVDAGTVALVVEAPPPGARPDALLQPAKKAGPRAAPGPPRVEAPHPVGGSRQAAGPAGAFEEHEALRPPRVVSVSPPVACDLP
jgi:hypothetical protein